MPTHIITVAAVERDFQDGWSITASANGRSSFRGEIVSTSYRPVLDDLLVVAEGVAIFRSWVAANGVVQTVETHGLTVGQTVQIIGHTGSTPAIDGVYAVVQVFDTYNFSIPVNITVAGGATGTVYRRTFGGNISLPNERSAIDNRSILTTIDAVNFSEMAEHRYLNEILPAGTLAATLTIIAARLGITLHALQVTGLTLSQIVCEWAKVREVLDLLTTLSGGYIWEINEFQYLRMALPASTLAPFNITDADVADEAIVGDMSVEPTRANYANRVILRYSEQAHPAYALLEIAGTNFPNASTVKVGSITYTFKTAITAAAYDVLIGGTARISLQHLIDAINLTGTPGTDYSLATTEHPSVDAYMLPTGSSPLTSGFSVMKAVASIPGASGNSTATEQVGSSAVWLDGSGVATATMKHGTDQVLTQVAIAEDLPYNGGLQGEQLAHDIWEVVVQAPEIVLSADADALAAAYLATHTPVPKTVRYPTRGRGLKPGQSQSITNTKRNILTPTVFTITDVNTRHVEKRLVWHDVTAVASPLLGAANRWQDYYRSTGGSNISSGSSVSGGGSGGGGTTIVNIVGGLIFFGGSQVIDWQTTSAGAWVVANSIEIRIDTVARGSTAGTLYVKLRAKSGSVTARLRNLTDSVTVGTSVALTSTTFVWTSFVVALTAGSKMYAIELSPSVANSGVQMGSGYLE